MRIKKYENSKDKNKIRIMQECTGNERGIIKIMKNNENVNKII